MDKPEVLRLAHQYSDLIQQHFKVKKIILFGSQLSGNAHPDSDIDIAVIMDGLDENYLDLLAELYRLRSMVDVHIEPILLDESRDQSGFVQEIIRTGEVIYQAPVI